MWFCDGFLEGSEFYLAIKIYLKFPMAGREIDFIRCNSDIAHEE